MANALVKRLKANKAPVEFPKQNKGNLEDFYDLLSNNKIGQYVVSGDLTNRQGSFWNGQPWNTQKDRRKSCNKGLLGKQDLIPFAQVINKRKTSDADMIAEIKMHALMDHPNIVKYHEMFDKPDGYYVVMELYV